MSGSDLQILDLVDLCLMKAARLGRARIAAEEGRDEFYERFFTDEDEQLLGEGRDKRKVVRLDGVSGAVRRHGLHGRLLDVGCGCGDNLKCLADLDGFELHGVEYSQSTLARAQRLLGTRAKLRQGSAMDLPYESVSFDTLTCIEVLEHVPDDVKAIKEMWRVLRPKGVLVLTVPSRHWFPEYKELIGHERHYDRASLVELLKSVGFELVEFIPNYPRWHRAADYAYVACRVIGRVAGVFGLDTSPHAIKVPLSRKDLLSLANDALVPLFDRDGRLPYERLSTSTSLVVRKMAS